MAFVISDVCVFDAAGAYVRTVRQVVPIDCNGLAGAPTSYIDGPTISATAPALPAGHTYGSCSCVESSDLCETMQDAISGQTATRPAITDKSMVIDASGACRIRESSRDLVYLFGGYASPGNPTSPDGVGGYVPSLLTPVINATFTAGQTAVGQIGTATSPTITITNPSSTRHMMVVHEYFENVFLNGHSSPSTNDPVSFRWDFEQSINGGAFALFNRGFTTVPPGWFIASPYLPLTRSTYVAPGESYTQTMKATLFHNSGVIDNSAGGALYQISAQAYGLLI
jgi:hypothetical protein